MVHRVCDLSPCLIEQVLLCRESVSIELAPRKHRSVSQGALQMKLAGNLISAHVAQISSGYSKSCFWGPLDAYEMNAIGGPKYGIPDLSREENAKVLGAHILDDVSTKMCIRITSRNR